MLKDLDGAAQRYELALAANPNDSLAWLFSGVLHAFQGVGDPAKAAAEKALSLSPLDPMMYFYQSLAASAVLASGDYTKAIALAQASLRANKAHSSTYRALTIALSLNKQMDEAKDTALRLLTIEPNFNVREFIRRSPSENYPAGQIYAQALRDAGVPE